jgi:hypothetical protein
MAATNAVFWDGKHWDGSEKIMIRSRTFPSKVPDSTHVELLSGSTLATITMTLQGIYSCYIVIKNGSQGDVPTFFALLAMIGLFRLQSAFWLSNEHGYVPFADWDAPVTTKPPENMISEAIYGIRSWRGVLFAIWWICSMSALAVYAIYECANGILFNKGDPGSCILISRQLERVFYTLFTVGTLIIHSFYVLRGKNNSTMIPCIQSRWCKVFIYILILSGIVGIVFACVETREG